MTVIEPSDLIVYITIFSFLFTIVGCLSILKFDILADELNPGIYSPDSKPFGHSYSDWLAKYSQWFIHFPKDSHPRNHYIPEMCSDSQNGPVLFLTDILSGKEERNCTIPSGKAVLLPVLSGRCWTDSKDRVPMTDDEITKCAMAGNEYGAISANVDGSEIQNINSYRSQSPFFNITVPENNLYNNVQGFWKAKADGFFLFLEPLTPGNHTINTKVSVFNTVSPEYNYAATLTYKLKVMD